MTSDDAHVCRPLHCPSSLPRRNHQKHLQETVIVLYDNNLLPPLHACQSMTFKTVCTVYTHCTTKLNRAGLGSLSRSQRSSVWQGLSLFTLHFVTVPKLTSELNRVSVNVVKHSCCSQHPVDTANREGGHLEGQRHMTIVEASPACTKQLLALV